MGPAAVRVRAAAPICHHPAVADRVRVPTRAAAPAHQIHLRRPVAPRLQFRRLAAVQSARARRADHRVTRVAAAQTAHPVVPAPRLRVARVLRLRPLVVIHPHPAAVHRVQVPRAVRNHHLIRHLRRVNPQSAFRSAAARRSTVHQASRRAARAVTPPVAKVAKVATQVLIHAASPVRKATACRATRIPAVPIQANRHQPAPRRRRVPANPNQPATLYRCHHRVRKVTCRHRRAIRLVPPADRPLQANRAVTRNRANPNRVPIAPTHRKA